MREGRSETRLSGVDGWGTEVKILLTPQGWTCVVTRLSKPSESAPPRVRPHVDCGLCALRRQRGLVGCDKCVTPVGMWVTGGGGGDGGHVEIVLPSSQFHCEHRTALKCKVYFKYV